MTTELRMLICSVVLGFVHIIAASHAASLQRGYRWTASARDDAVAPLIGVAGRLGRALRNFSETFPLFAALVFAAQTIGRHTALTEYGTVLYFVARLIYLPLYAFGVPLIRSLVWNVAALGMGLMLVALVWA
ncbi:MAG TPA: MAPEG family protein [Bradyrhizobium sp.]|uniref:MAPEG family protein n=1 Tax=Bradyrhizobium sp. TaxID=376 RepID=UPI002BFDB0F2|nr:MAPEG family protein [Bradyrhizobium sp.]HLZ00825.1 MAPEG family protein [Bradyrhizobium sp.]